MVRLPTLHRDPLCFTLWVWYMVPTVDSDSNKDKRMGSHRCQKSNFYWFHSGQQFWSDRETSFSFFCTECTCVIHDAAKLNHVCRSDQNCLVKQFLVKRQDILKIKLLPLLQITLDCLVFFFNWTELNILAILQCLAYQRPYSQVCLRLSAKSKRTKHCTLQSVGQQCPLWHFFKRGQR